MRSLILPFFRAVPEDLKDFSIIYPYVQFEKFLESGWPAWKIVKFFFNLLIKIKER